jgi:hypothetical protein
MNLRTQTLLFNSTKENFLIEKRGQKPSTTRDFDLADERHQKAVAMMVLDHFGFIRIACRDLPEEEPFTRRITHIAQWQDRLTFTWKHSNEI